MGLRPPRPGERRCGAGLCDPPLRSRARVEFQRARRGRHLYPAGRRRCPPRLGKRSLRAREAKRRSPAGDRYAAHEHPRRALDRLARYQRRQARERPREHLVRQVSLHPRGAGDHRPLPLSPAAAEAALKGKGKLPDTKFFTVDEQFGGWTAAVQQHFAKGRLAEQILHTADTAPVASSYIATR
ncbi:MAG: hypothetical protein WDM96_06910 [Lacunisphaera sp.]